MLQEMMLMLYPNKQEVQQENPLKHFRQPATICQNLVLKEQSNISLCSPESDEKMSPKRLAAAGENTPSDN